MNFLLEVYPYGAVCISDATLFGTTKERIEHLSSPCKDSELSSGWNRVFGLPRNLTAPLLLAETIV